MVSWDIWKSIYQYFNVKVARKKELELSSLYELLTVVRTFDIILSRKYT